MKAFINVTHVSMGLWRCGGEMCGNSMIVGKNAENRSGGVEMNKIRRRNPRGHQQSMMGRNKHGEV